MQGRKRILAAAILASITSNRIAFAQAVVTRVPGPQPARAENNPSCAGDTSRVEMEISKDGRFVVYESEATNLVPGTPIDTCHIYLFDTTTQKTTCVTPNANADSTDPAISADGRFIVFSTRATNLIGNDTNNASDIYLVDRDVDGNGIFDEQPYSFERISVTSSGSEAHGASVAPSISDDGSLVLFLSAASDLVTNDKNKSWDAFLRDRAAGTTTRVDVSTAGTEAANGCLECDLSGDGKTVVFASASSNLVTGDNNGFADVFLLDLIAGTTTRISFGIKGTESNGASSLIQHSVSRDGGRVAFTSAASNLDSHDGRAGRDVFVYDRGPGTITMVDFDSGGVQADGECYAATISTDGTKIAFTGLADNLTSNDNNRWNDVFVRDTVAGTTTCLSKTAAGATGDWMSLFVVLNGDGTKAAFSSVADDIVNNGWSDGYQNVYFADLGAATVQYASAVPAGETNGPSISGDPSQVSGSWPNQCSADGRWIVFESGATNLVADDYNGASDVFVCDRTTGAVTCMSLGTNGLPATGTSRFPTISGNGRYVAFESAAPNLVANDLNSVIGDIFRVDRDPDRNGIFDEGNAVTILVSVDSNGNSSNGESTTPVISADGNRIAFGSFASNLSSIDTNGVMDVFVRDVSAGQTILVSELGGVCGDAESFSPSLSGNGEVVAFMTLADNLGYSPQYFMNVVRHVDYDSTDYFDIPFTGDVFEWLPPQALSYDGSRFIFIDVGGRYGNPWGAVELCQFIGHGFNAPPALSFDIGPTWTSAAIDANGDAIAVGSQRSDLAGNDSNASCDEFLLDIVSDGTGFPLEFKSAVLASRNPNGDPGNGASAGGGISADGNVVPFKSLAADLVAGDHDGLLDVFVLDRSKSARWLNYGVGFDWPAFSKPLTADADPVLGTTITIQLENLSGSATTAILFLSANPADVQLTWGATFLVDMSGALFFTIPLGAGGGSLQGTLPDDDALAGVQLFLQSLQPDPYVPHQLAFTPGLELQLGR